MNDLEIYKGYIVVGKQDKVAAIGETYLKVSSFRLRSRYLKVLTPFHTQHFQEQELDLRATGTDGIRKKLRLVVGAMTLTVC